MSGIPRKALIPTGIAGPERVKSIQGTAVDCCITDFHAAFG